MTSHDEFAAAAAAYAIDALDRDEQRAFEAHLSTCAPCQADVADYRRVAGGLGLAVEPIKPSPDLKARVLASAMRQNRPARAVLPTSATPWWLLAAAAMAFLATGLYAWSLRVQLAAVRDTAAAATNEARTARAELADIRLESARVARTLAVMGSPDVVRVEMAGKETAASATGRAYWSRSRGLVFNADRLPALPAGRVYQLWVLAPTPVSVGVLTVAADGTATLTAALAAGLPPVAAVAVTSEPGPAGSASPTMPILLVGAVKASAGD